MAQTENMFPWHCRKQRGRDEQPRVYCHPPVLSGCLSAEGKIYSWHLCKRARDTLGYLLVRSLLKDPISYRKWARVILCNKINTMRPVFHGYNAQILISSSAPDIHYK